MFKCCICTPTLSRIIVRGKGVEGNFAFSYVTTYVYMCNCVITCRSGAGAGNFGPFATPNRLISIFIRHDNQTIISFCSAYLPQYAHRYSDKVSISRKWLSCDNFLGRNVQFQRMNFSRRAECL